MSTPLGAVYNRCRPVPPWNGSSSASLLRQATTRCSRGCKREAGRREAGSGKGEAGSGVIAATILLVPALLLSQQTAPAPILPSHPEVVNLTLKGVKAMKPADLQQSIYTTASYCNSILLKPFCWISKSKYFYTRKYLDHKELERDVLRVRIFYWKRGYRET